jgi:hypothetical protein
MRALVLAVLVGCEFTPRAGTSDAPIDGIALVDACASVTEQFATCGFGAGSDLSISSDSVYNTDTGLLMTGSAQTKLDDTHVVASTGVTVDVLVVDGFQLSATLTVQGTLPLAIYATGDVAIANHGRLTVAVGGAGVRSTCPLGPAIGTADNNGGGGGGGGGFQGAGGSGEGGNSDKSAGGAGGGSNASPGAMLGGCTGGAGGDGQSSGTGGVGGLGGGALLIATPGTIAIDVGGGIDAGGQGGRPGTSPKGGGGGGGSGGLIVLEARTITNAGYVVANGGGGGEGGESATNGFRGDDGRTDAMLAAGGAGGSNGGTGGGDNGGNGGSGGAGLSLAGSDATDAQPDGGGGGGGGVGYIGVNGTVTGSGLFSPAQTIWP